MKKSATLGIDIGGTHFTTGIIDPTHHSPLRTERVPLNSFHSAFENLSDIAGRIQETAIQHPDITRVGLAFPGPFHYRKGVCRMTGVGGKFEKMYGLHVKQALKNLVNIPRLSYHFANDAHCFARGAKEIHRLQGTRTLFITLGTGLGSAFMENGALVFSGEHVPAEGYLYNLPFLTGTAEDFLSARWFLNKYQDTTGSQARNVKDIANEASIASLHLFAEFGTHLGQFLREVMLRFACEELVIGGNIGKSFPLFSPSLEKELQTALPRLRIVYTDDTDACIVTGAALLASESPGDASPETSALRRSSQPLLPVSKKREEQNGYDVIPTYPSTAPVFKGFDTLAEQMIQHTTVVIDGYQGVYWEQLREQLQETPALRNRKVFWYDIDSCLHNSTTIDQQLINYLNGDDPVFGKKYPGQLADFFDEQQLKLLQPDPGADLCILYGTGAALAGWKGWLLYADVPKNEIQYRMRAQQIHNIGAEQALSDQQAYKRFYFVDWPVLNRHKETLLPVMDIIIDAQRISEITWMQGADLRQVLDDMLQHAIRARPWFEKGIWGGQWMKEHINGLNREERNYAWSFELITPENGIVIEGTSTLLEISFDMLLFHNHHALLGKAARTFGKEFPIRFDFLDTFDGGNLSVQCHPRTPYIQEQFGESFTQDETYYILDCKEDARVYLGFQEDINPTAFKTALVNAQQKAVAVDIEKFVQVHDAKKHDLFLIPNGTVHASGKNNMVLEISNTPYIFTFKMYDWLRTDLNGMPRPINIEHAFNNLYFDRKGDYVAQQLISHPVVVSQWEEGRKISLPTHPEHFYAIDRYEFRGHISIATQGQCHCCMLVEGNEIEVETGGRKNRFGYAETFVIPASVDSYHVTLAGNATGFLLVAYVKNDPS